MEPQNTEGNTQGAAPTPQTTPSSVPATEGNNSTLMGILAYIGILVLIPLIMEKHDPFVRYHVKQGLVLFVIEAALWVIGSMVYGLWVLISLINLGAVVLSIIGIINVVNKKQVALPLVGQFADKFKV
jgi:uncharacterized membrane protein